LIKQWNEIILNEEGLISLTYKQVFVVKLPDEPVRATAPAVSTDRPNAPTRGACVPVAEMLKKR
jgi:hypothetical protein